MDVAYETEPGHAMALDWIADRAGGNNTFLINWWDQLSAEALDFHLAARHWPRWSQRTVVGVLLADPGEAPVGVEQFRDTVIATAPSHLVHLANAPVENAGAWWAYQAAISTCWDGEWTEATSVWVHQWDTRAHDRALAEPIPLLRARARDELRAELWYPLLIDLSHAECSGQ
jgi:hypothetical protein